MQVMATFAPVAGSLVPLDASRHRLVVESAPESEATRGFKNVARYVFRFVQAEQWSGAGGAITVRVVGEADVAATISMNVGLLLAPLLDVAIERSAITESALDVAVDDDAEYPNPRHRVWLVPREAMVSEADRFGLAIGPADPDDLAGAHLALVLAAHGAPIADPPASDPETEIAVVLVDAPSIDHPTDLRIGP